MATSERLTENYLTCIICSEVYSDPATLQCDHTFCKPCLLKFIKTQPAAIQARSIPCPSCRQMTRVLSPDTPLEDWVNQVKPSRLIQRLVEDFGPGKEIKDSRLCDMCKHEGKETPAISWCPECEESLCDNCLGMHRRVSMTREHQVISLTGDSMPQPKRRFMCTEHTDEQVKLFCEDCNKAICHTCCSIKHRKCDTVVTIESMISGVKKTLENKKDVTLKMIKGRRERLSQEKKQIENLVKTTNQVEAEVKAASQKVVDMIREKERKLLENITKLKDEQLEEVRARIKSEEITVQGYQQQFEFIDHAIKSERRKDMLAMYESCGDSADDPGKVLEYRPLDRIRFTQDMVKLSKAVDDLHLGEVEVVKGVSDRKSSAVLHRTIDCQIEGDESNPDLYDVLVLSVPDGKIIVVADYDNKNVKLFYNLKSKEFKKSLKLPGSPFQITHIRDANIAISLGSAQKLVFVTCGVPDPVITSTIQTKHMYFGLACLSPTQLLGGTYNQTNSVDTFNLSGIILTSFNTGIVKNPDYIHVTKKKNVIVSERSVKSVVSVSSDGEVIFTYSPTGHRALEYPCGITSTNTGDILLTDGGLHKVIQLTESGQFVRDVTTEGLESPRGLCLDDDGLLYVASTTCVKVYRFE